MLILSAGYARPKGLAHPRLSMVGPLRGPMYARRAGDHKGRPYTRGCICSPPSGTPSPSVLSAGYARRAGDLAGTVGATLVVARIRGYAPPPCACLAVVRATTRVAPTPRLYMLAPFGVIYAIVYAQEMHDFAIFFVEGCGGVFIFAAESTRRRRRKRDGFHLHRHFPH